MGSNSPYPGFSNAALSAIATMQEDERDVYLAPIAMLFAAVSQAKCDPSEAGIALAHKMLSKAAAMWIDVQSVTLEAVTACASGVLSPALRAGFISKGIDPEEFMRRFGPKPSPPAEWLEDVSEEDNVGD